LKIIQESFSRDSKTQKIKFRTVLQTSNEVNGNKRWYSRDTIKEIVEGLKPKVDGRALLQEIDHPIIMGVDINSDSMKRRAVTIELKNCGGLIIDIKQDGDNLIGTIETLSGFKGPDLRNLIKEDNVNIGFSLRMFGQLKPHSIYEGVMEVVAPLRPITYDVVSNPSHKSAKIMQFVTESTTIYDLSEEKFFDRTFDINDSFICFDPNDDKCIRSLKNDEVQVFESNGSLIPELAKLQLCSTYDNSKPLKFKI
jgi:hypothetical protein